MYVNARSRQRLRALVAFLVGWIIGGLGISMRLFRWQ